MQAAAARDAPTTAPRGRQRRCTPARCRSDPAAVGRPIRVLEPRAGRDDLAEPDAVGVDDEDRLELACCAVARDTSEGDLPAVGRGEDRLGSSKPPRVTRRAPVPSARMTQIDVLNTGCVGSSASYAIHWPSGDPSGASWTPGAEVSGRRARYRRDERWRRGRPSGPRSRTRCGYPTATSRRRTMDREVSRRWLRPSTSAVQRVVAPTAGSNRPKLIRPFSDPARGRGRECAGDSEQHGEQADQGGPAARSVRPADAHDSSLRRCRGDDVRDDADAIRAGRAPGLDPLATVAGHSPVRRCDRREKSLAVAWAGRRCPGPPVPPGAGPGARTRIGGGSARGGRRHRDRVTTTARRRGPARWRPICGRVGLRRRGPWSCGRPPWRRPGAVWPMLAGSPGRPGWDRPRGGPAFRPQPRPGAAAVRSCRASLASRPHAALRAFPARARPRGGRRAAAGAAAVSPSGSACACPVLLDRYCSAQLLGQRLPGACRAGIDDHRRGSPASGCGGGARRRQARGRVQMGRASRPARGPRPRATAGPRPGCRRGRGRIASTRSSCCPTPRSDPDGRLFAALHLARAAPRSDGARGRAHLGGRPRRRECDGPSPGSRRNSRSAPPTRAACGPSLARCRSATPAGSGVLARRRRGCYVDAAATRRVVRAPGPGRSPRRPVRARAGRSPP